MSDDWGPWTEHDGSRCSLDVGAWFEVETYGIWRGRNFSEGRLTLALRGVPHWTVGHPDNPRCTMVVRYRVRKPREAILADLPPTKVLA